jgi:hypothetical protein
LGCFAAVARFSDVQRLTRKDVSIVEGKVMIEFRTRKNDQHHVGLTAFLFPSGNRYCPVKITERYLALLPPGSDQPMLPDLNHMDREASYAAGRAAQKRIMFRLGVDSAPYGLHSARVGASKYLETELKLTKRTHELMAEMAGWAENSAQPSLYAKKAEDKHRRQAAILRLG